MTVKQMVLLAGIFFLCMYTNALAGDLEPPSGNPAPTMHTLSEIYDAVDATEKNSLYVPYLLETTGSGGGAYNADIFLMNTTAADIDVTIYVFNLDGSSTSANGVVENLSSGATTIISIEALLGTISGAAICNVRITSADPNFNPENIADFAVITEFLPGGGTTGYEIKTLWKAE